jgi:hypothetical protein
MADRDLHQGLALVIGEVSEGMFQGHENLPCPSGGVNGSRNLADVSPSR